MSTAASAKPEKQASAATEPKRDKTTGTANGTTNGKPTSPGTSDAAVSIGSAACLAMVASLLSNAPTSGNTTVAQLRHHIGVALDLIERYGK